MVSVVIPAYNECMAIGQTVAQVLDVLRETGLEHYEVIVVDDGSSDDTGSIAAEHGARVVRHPHNGGYGRSLKDGIECAQYDTIVITDADGTYPIDRIPDLLREFDEGFDMVVGARTGQHYRGSAIKWPMRIMLRFLVEWSAGRSIPDINSGLRVFSRSCIHSYFGQLCEGFSFTTSVTLAYMLTGRFVRYVDIDYADRVGETHVRLWRDSIRTLQFIVQAITYYNPLKLFLLLSLLCMVVAIVSVTVGIVFKIATGFTMGVGSIVGAFIIFSMGLMADLLRQILSSGRDESPLEATASCETQRDES